MNLRKICLLSTMIAGFAALGAASAAAQGVQHFAVLNGGNEVDNNGNAAAGDPDGSGAAAIILRGTPPQVCFAIAVDRIGNPTVAHIHEEEAGANGPIRVNLVAPANGNPGFSSGCVGGVAAGLLNRLRETPNRFYVNVHNNAFPNGAVRGQLF